MIKYQNRVYVETEGALGIIFNADRTIAGAFDASKRVSCDECAQSFLEIERYQKGFFLQSTRIEMHWTARFCSRECMDTHWASVKPTQWQVDNPATLQWYLCPKCQTGNKSVVAAFGEIVPRQQGRRLEICNQDGQVLRTMRLRHAHAECTLCNGARVVSPAPAFFDARPGDAFWRECWATRIDFDRDLRMTVYENGPRQIQVMEWIKGSELPRVLPEIIVGRMLFERPTDFLAWWRTHKVDKVAALA